MTTIILAPEFRLVVGIIAEGVEGWGGFAILDGRPAPIGVRATQATAISKVVSLCVAAGLPMKVYDLQEIAADISVVPHLAPGAPMTNDHRSYR